MTLKITIKRLNYFTDICQIRLDFTSLKQAQPTATTGACGTDTLTIAPGGGAGVAPGTAAPPVLCGTNTGQHGT